MLTMPTLMEKIDMKKFLLALLLGLIIGIAPTQSPLLKCSISERVVLENATDAPVTHIFTRGLHEGFVVVSPGQTIIVDIVRCE